MGASFNVEFIADLTKHTTILCVKALISIPVDNPCELLEMFSASWFAEGLCM